MKKGYIVLVPFPFTDLKGNKYRPAIVLFSDTTDVTVCFITTELKWQKKFDMILEPDPINGLKALSLIRLNKITTLDIHMVAGILGYLPKIQLHKLNTNLKGMFSLDDGSE